MRCLIYNKKAQVNSIAPAIIALVVAATFLILGLIMTSSLTNSVDSVSNRINNETVTKVNESGTPLGVIDFCNFNSVTLLFSTNTTNAQVNTGNFTVNETGYITYVGNDGFLNNTPQNITYSFNWGDTACQTGENTVTGLGTFADFWTIIVLAIVISVVIGLLLIVFGGNRRR